MLLTLPKAFTYPYSNSRERGLGIIEVLISMIVIAVGMLALAQLQSSVTQESRVNKARSAALEVCNSRIAAFRKPLLEADFLALASTSGAVSTTTETINWTLDVTPFNREKSISATCSWSGGEVTLSTLAVPHSSLATKLTTGGGDGSGSGLSPSLNAGSSVDLVERVAVSTVDGLQNRIGNDSSLGKGSIVAINQDDEKFYRIENTERDQVTVLYLCENTTSYPILNSDFGLRAQRWDIDTIQEGLEGIRLYESFDDSVRGDGQSGNRTLCEAKVLYRGGVLFPVAGLVHSRVKSGNSYLEVDFLTFDISESGTYCAFDAQPNDTSAPYICYLGGNCEYGPFTSDGSAETNFTVCPEVVTSTGVDATNFDMTFDVGEGGWRGKIGLLDVANQGYNVCFAEELDGQESTRDTAREYKTVNGTGTDALAQGINQGQSCHDFMIIDGVNNPNHVALRKACVTAASDLVGETLGTKLITRALSTGTSNIYIPSSDTTYCAAIPSKYVNGEIINRNGIIPYVIAIDEDLKSAICNVVVDSNDASKALYDCTVPTNAANLEVQVKITPTYTLPNPSCFVSAATTSGTSNGCTIDLSPISSAGLTSNSVGGSISATTENYAKFESDSGGISTLAIIYDDLQLPCELGVWDSSSSERLFSCNFFTDDPIDTESSVMLYADAADGYVMTPDYVTDAAAIASSAITSFPSNRTDFALEIELASTGSTRNLSGSITLDPRLSINDVDMNASSSACVISGTSNPYNYSCEISLGEVQITYIGGSCSSFGKSAKKITATASGAYPGTGTTDTGQLTITVSTGTSDVMIDMSFLEATSGQNCGK